jgi:molybdopterin molybdotransferase
MSEPGDAVGLTHVQPLQSGMLSLDEALAFMLSQVQPLPANQAHSLNTAQADGCVLAQAVVSAVHVPPFDNSAMDGYALRLADLPAPTLPISQRITAGSTPGPLQVGSAARIFTGAPLPLGADCVVMQEHCVATPSHVTIQVQPKAGQAIRRQGEDVCQGAVVLPQGLRLTPQALGLAAASGASQLNVMRPVRVALLSTGNELCLPGEPLAPGAIYNSNRYTLRALIEKFGAQCTDFGVVPDELGATQKVLHEAAQGHDLVISSGGVSVGEQDHLRAALVQEGQLSLWQIAIKPGKPLAFGQLPRSQSSRSQSSEPTWLLFYLWYGPCSSVYRALALRCQKLGSYPPIFLGRPNNAVSFCGCAAMHKVA